MTRVLIVEPAGGLWGSERALLDLIDATCDLEIAVCCPPGSPLQIELGQRGIRTLPWFVAELHRKSRWRRLQAALGVIRACITFRPDVIHVNQSGAYRVVLPAASLLNLPMVCHVRIFEDVAYLAKRSPVTKRLKALIAISGAVEAEIKRFPPLRAVPVHRIYDAYAPTSTATDVERQPGRFACVGRITPIKGQELLVHTLQMTDLFEGKVEALIVGDGEADYVRLLKDMAPAAGPVHAIWTGFVADVLPLLSTCRALVCPSHREPLGRVIFEAWNAGAVPVVFAGSGGAAEIVTGSNGGLTYDAQSPAALSDALKRVLRLGAKERNALVENGRNWMVRNCSQKRYAAEIAHVMRRAAADGINEAL